MEVKNSEIKPDPLCLGNISKGFTLSNMKKKTALKGIVNIFFLSGTILLILVVF